MTTSAAGASLTDFAIRAAERGRLADIFLRAGIRRLVRERLAEIQAGGCEAIAARRQSFIEEMETSEIALLPQEANRQHYEVPAAFFGEVLGPHRKYSSAWWGDGISDLAAAEEAALTITATRAGLEDGMRILELGCGWGSLTLWMASHYPNAHITALSNSNSQRLYIEGRAAERGLGNIEIITCDINDFDTDTRFHRVVSVEMFEHVRNYRRAFEGVRRWLAPKGRFFMHIFCHRDAPYPFVPRSPGDWMSRHFFSGGIMPSDGLPFSIPGNPLLPIAQWRWSGVHYRRTADAWLANMDRSKERIMPIFESVYGSGQATIWWHRWRIFWMSCAELFGYDAGQQWWVSHYLFGRD
ncbi:MAG: class I SAM-dependent methyltransferase [Ectothiorhodospiraceae bacterium AqS1]|nr:class I SAM-dependent methyltransferase [Ectothiorhodospiraceae bacterium AqS1]